MSVATWGTAAKTIHDDLDLCVKELVREENDKRDGAKMRWGAELMTGLEATNLRRRPRPMPLSRASPLRRSRAV